MRLTYNVIDRPNHSLTQKLLTKKKTISFKYLLSWKQSLKLNVKTQI